MKLAPPVKLAPLAVLVKLAPPPLKLAPQAVLAKLAPQFPYKYVFGSWPPLGRTGQVGPP